MSAKNKFRFWGWIELLRPENVFIALLVVWVGFQMTGVCPRTWVGWLTGLTVAAITAAGNALNDVLDVDVDRVAHPERPIPSGRVSPQGALGIAVVLFLVGLGSAWTLGQMPFLVAGLAVLGILMYNLWAKWVPLLGNLLVSGIAALTFLFVGVVVGEIRAMIFPFLFAFLFHWAREIVKDIQDAGADRIRQARTLPLWLGETFAWRMAKILLAILVMVTLIPYALGLFGKAYLLVVVLGVDIPLILFILGKIRRPAAQIQEWLKVEILVGLVALTLWRIG